MFTLFIMPSNFVELIPDNFIEQLVAISPTLVPVAEFVEESQEISSKGPLAATSEGFSLLINYCFGSFIEVSVDCGLFFSFSIIGIFSKNPTIIGLGVTFGKIALKRIKSLFLK